MDVLKTVVTVLEAIFSLALIVIVLLQSGKEAGLSGAIAGGGNDTYMSKSKSGSWDKKMAFATKWIALVWVLLTLSLSLF